jgi:hypothetical protein
LFFFLPKKTVQSSTVTCRFHPSSRFTSPVREADSKSAGDARYCSHVHGIVPLCFLIPPGARNIMRTQSRRAAFPPPLSLLRHSPPVTLPRGGFEFELFSTRIRMSCGTLQFRPPLESNTIAPSIHDWW